MLFRSDLAQKVSDYVLCVHNNSVERYGTPEEIFTSEYIMQLYGATRGSYNASFGSLEMERVQGKPEVFVIGGGGKGIPVYRQLQRQGIPFAAGVLHENDLDYPVAAALAVEVIPEQSFEPIGEAAFAQAAALVEGATPTSTRSTKASRWKTATSPTTVCTPTTSAPANI